MDALISGRAGHAVVLDGEGVGVVRAGAPEELEPRQWAEVPSLLRSTDDFELALDVSLDEISNRLGKARLRVLVLELMLTVQDRKLPHATRRNAACEVEELMLQEDVGDLLRDVLYAHPAPEEADLEGSLGFCRSVGAVTAYGLCQEVLHRQPQITAVRCAWEAIPIIDFGGIDEFRQWQAAAVRLGLFRQLVESKFQTESDDDLRARVASMPGIKELPYHGIILDRWILSLDSRRPIVADEPDLEVENRFSIEESHAQDLVAEPIQPYDAEFARRRSHQDLRVFRIQYEESLFRLDANFRHSITQGEDAFTQLQKHLSKKEIKQAETYFRGLASIEERDQESAIMDLALGALAANEFIELSDDPVSDPVLSASRLIDKFAISDPRDIDLEAIAMSRNVLVVDSGLEGSEARLVRARDGGVIRLRPSIFGKGRRRFALAHELAHWELHAGQSQSHFCSEADIREYRGSNLEIEANHFAAELLMPAKLFRPFCVNAEPDIDLARELATKFNCSLTAAAVRFVEECSEYCVVIFSVDGRVTWWRDALGRRGNQQRKYWLGSGQEVREGTGAWECLQGSSSSGPMREVDPAQWFPNTSDVSDISVREQSIRLGSYPTIMTMLWIGSSSLSER